MKYGNWQNLELETVKSESIKKAKICNIYIFFLKIITNYLLAQLSHITSRQLFMFIRCSWVDILIFEYAVRRLFQKYRC